MKIGILGAGAIGATLARKLSGAGHEVRIANSRGPETVDPAITAAGATAVDAGDAVDGIDVLITSIPLSRMPAIRPLIADLPVGTVVIDTSNYYPMRDGQVRALDDGQVESVWVTEQLGRPVAKAWNAILSGSFEAKGAPAGDPGRIAIPVAADRRTDKAVAMQLVEDTGFDAVDAGSLADSWRQQPGAPAYCTELARQDLTDALGKATKNLIPERRDRAMAAIGKKLEDDGTLTSDDLVKLNRAIYF
jgi:predicted dinucleotide-binding enzyme